MDKYTKFILTLIAVGIIGINIHLFKGGIVSSAQAGFQAHVVGTDKYVVVTTQDGSIACSFKPDSVFRDLDIIKWTSTGC